MNAPFLVIDLVMGIVQIAAMLAGLQAWLGWPFWLAALVALLSGGFLKLPFGSLIGCVLGVFGAWKGWGWPFLGALLLFLWWPILMGVVTCNTRKQSQ